MPLQGAIASQSGLTENDVKSGKYSVNQDDAPRNHMKRNLLQQRLTQGQEISSIQKVRRLPDKKLSVRPFSGQLVRKVRHDAEYTFSIRNDEGMD
jgi:hypothetical protein